MLTRNRRRSGILGESRRSKEGRSSRKDSPEGLRCCWSRKILFADFTLGTHQDDPVPDV